MILSTTVTAMNFLKNYAKNSQHVPHYYSAPEKRRLYSSARGVARLLS